MRKPLALAAAVLGLLLLLWWWQGGSRELRDLGSDQAALVAAADPFAPEPADSLAAEQVLERHLLEEPPPKLDEQASSGDLSLVLRFFQEQSSTPASGPIQLWQLNVPENEAWTAGDVLLLETEVQEGRLEVPHLAPGSYRVHSLFARKGSPALPSFELAYDHQQVEFLVPMPRKETAHITWFRPDGTLLRGQGEVFERRWKGSSSSMVSNPRPAWAKPRTQKTAEDFGLVFGGRGAGGRFGSRLHQSWQQQQHAEGRYALGELEQDSRLWRHTAKSTWRLGARQGIELLVHAEGTGDYAAVFVETREIQARLRFPTGVEPQDLRQKMNLQCESVGFGLRPNDHEQPILHAEQAWQQSLLRIRITSPDFEPVDIPWRPIDGPLPWIPLTPKLVDAKEH